MDTNNSSPPPAGVTGDWRAQLAPDSRMETLKRHLPFSGQEGLEELKKIAVRFEEKIYFAAKNQQDYLRKISLKMITMDNKSQNTVPNPFQSNSLNNNSSSKPLIQSQLHNQGQSLPMQLPSSLQSHQQLLSQNTQKNAASVGVQASLDSTCQTGHADGVDWQEEVYQKIKALKETYLPELNEMHQKIAAKFQQIESLSQPPKREQVEKMKVFKAVLERIMAFLQIPKHSIAPNFKEKLGSYEKQIINFINSNRPRKPPSQQLGGPGQIVPTQMHSMQQSQSQITPTQSHENPVNPHAQSMNLQGSATTMQQSSIANLQHSSQTQQNMMNSPQPGSKLVSTGQGYVLISMQWAPVGSSSQKPVRSPQQASKNAPQYLVLKLILILLLVIILFQMASLLQTGKSYSLAQFALVKWFGG